MIYWIKKFALIIAYLGFFIIFFSGINFEDPFDVYTASLAFLKAACGGIILWFSGFVIGDIILKGAVEDIPMEHLEVLEGGLVQRIHESKVAPQVLDNAEKSDCAAEEDKVKKTGGK